jgi:hypothetical protein
MNGFGFAPRLGATLCASSGNAKLGKQPSRQENVGDYKGDRPNPVWHVSSRLLGPAKFTQKRGHWIPIRESRLQQVQADQCVNKYWCDCRSVAIFERLGWTLPMAGIIIVSTL